MGYYTTYEYEGGGYVYIHNHQFQPWRTNNCFQFIWLGLVIKHFMQIVTADYKLNKLEQVIWAASPICKMEIK